MKKNKKSIGRTFIVEWKIFPFDVLVCLGVDRKNVLKSISKHYSLDEEEKEHLTMVGSGKTVMLRGGQTVLWLKDYPKPGSGILTHEIFHAVYFLLGELGINISDDSEELVAYMMQYLNNQIVKKMVTK